MSAHNIISPSWSCPDNVTAFSTCRHSGNSQAPYDSFNLALHVRDAPDAVKQNRQQLRETHGFPKEPCWLEQVHGDTVINLKDYPSNVIADASVTQTPNTVCTIMTGDCLPILICNTEGNEVAAIHGGWRSLAKGIITKTLEKLQTPPDRLMAWLGPAISREVYQVDDAMMDHFLKISDEYQQCFTPQSANHALADLKAIATLQLRQSGLNAISVDEHCTYRDEDLFFSHRRDGLTGRMGHFIWFSGAK